MYKRLSFTVLKVVGSVCLDSDSGFVGEVNDTLVESVCVETNVPRREHFNPVVFRRKSRQLSYM